MRLLHLERIINWSVEPIPCFWQIIKNGSRTIMLLKKCSKKYSILYRKIKINLFLCIMRRLYPIYLYKYPMNM